MDGQLNKSSSAFWILLTLTAASIEPIIVKLGYQSGVSPLQLLLLKNLFAAATILLLTRKWQWLGWKGIAQVASVSTLLLATNGLVLYALKHMTAASVVTVVTTTPAFVAIVNQMRGKDQLARSFWLGFGLCFIGVLLSIGAVSIDRHLFHPFGFAALILAVASSTTYRTRMDSLTQILEPRSISTYIFLLNALFTSIFLWPWLDPIPEAAIAPSVWIGAAAALANLAFLSAIKVVGSTRMSIFDMLQRPLVILAAALILGEQLSPLQILGVAMVLIGVRLAKVQRQQGSKTYSSAAIAPQTFLCQREAANKI